MIDINWNNFKSKFNGKERGSFELLAYMLFCYEHGIPTGITRFKNQTGIETEPIDHNGRKKSFQAKYFDTKLSSNKKAVIDSITKAKRENPQLDLVILYTNQELTESKKKTQKKPAWLLEIQAAAKSLGIAIDWRLPSHMEVQLSVPINDYLAQYFFSLGKSIVDFIDTLKEHTGTILYSIQTDIDFNGNKIKISRDQDLANLQNSSSQATILSGDGGSGKTALIKDYYATINTPFYVFKAAEFYKASLADIFKQFGEFGLDDFLYAHAEYAVKTVVIDSAEKLAELEELDYFKEFLSALIKNKWRVIFTTRNNYLDDLKFQMIDIYRLSHDTIQVENLKPDQLQQLSVEHGFTLPSDPRLQKMICNLFYLSEYLGNYDLISGLTDISSFRTILWQKKIQNAKFKKDNTHLERETCFLGLAKMRAESGHFFQKCDACSGRILSLLEKDEIIKYDAPQDGYFITHDIYEEWALEKMIDRAYQSKTSFKNFFDSIGSALPTRRAFRAWLSDMLVMNDPFTKQFIDESFTDSEVLSHWKDELLVSVLLSDYAARFFEIFATVILENEKAYLHKIIFLLRTACQEIDSDMVRLLQGGDAVAGAGSLMHVYTRPKGKGWEAAIEFLHTKLGAFTSEEIGQVLPLMKDWTAKHGLGKTTRLAGLFALHFYCDSETNKESYYSDDTEKLLLKIVLESTGELKTELKEITDILLGQGFNRQLPYDSLRDAVLKSHGDGTAYHYHLPDYTLKLANSAWFREKKNRHPFDTGGPGMEAHYSIRSSGYSPASALQTPLFFLLSFAKQQAVDFILDFTNRAVEAYYNSKYDENVHETELTIDGVTTKQIISETIWQMYRGTGSPVTPYLLQSMHMALEKHFLAQAKTMTKENLQSWMKYLLKKTRSASVTAVVTSIVLANPDKLFEIAEILFSNYQFFLYDTHRQAREGHAENLYSIGRNLRSASKYFDEERLATCKEPHRKETLEFLALKSQYIKNEEVTDEEFDRRVTIIHAIIDNLKTKLPNAEKKPEENKMARLLLTRIDRRMLTPEVTQVETGFQVTLNPELDEDLTAFSDAGTKVFNDTFQYTALKMWATSKTDRGAHYGPYPQYDNDPQLALKEVKEIVEGMNKSEQQNYGLFNGDIPGLACAALIKECSERLSADDLKYCKDVVMAFAYRPVRENYGYQIHDGVEAAISVIPLLYKLYPEETGDYNFLLMLLLFDRYSIGAYKRVCDYAIEAIANSLCLLSPEDAKEIWIAFLVLHPKFDKAIRERTQETRDMSRVQFLMAFLKKHEKALAKLDDSNKEFKKLKIDQLDLRTSETAFHLISADTTEPLFLDYIKKILPGYAKQLLARDHYGRDPREEESDYHLEHRFFIHYASFVLHRDVASVETWVKPFVDEFVATDKFANLLSEFITAENRLNKYDSFWKTWECFYPKIKAAAAKDRNRYMNQAIYNYMLAWPWWNDNATDWRSFKEKDALFFKKICTEMGQHPAVLYSIAKFLNDIGSNYLNQGVAWIGDMLTKHPGLFKTDLLPNTEYYLEKLVRKFVYLNRTRLKSDKVVKDKTLAILSFLISKSSVNAYLLREEIL